MDSFNELLRMIEDVDVQMQYAGQFSADTKMPPLTLQGMKMSHSNKLALGKQVMVLSSAVE